MKRCPECGRTFTNNSLINCLNDGTPLVEEAPEPPPYFGAPAAAAAPNFAEPPLPSASPFEAPGTATYTDTPLSEIPELQSPEMQKRLQEALQKAGMPGLLDAALHSTVTVTTSTTTSQPGTPFFNAQTPSPGYAATPPPPYAAAAAPARKRSPWAGLAFWLLILFAILIGYEYLKHKNSTHSVSVPTDIAAAIKTADAAEASAVKSLNPRPLASAYAGPALAQEISRLHSLQRAKTTVDEQLVSQEFSGCQVSSDGATAKVEVTETWNTTTYSEPSHTEIAQKSADVNPQTVFLTRTPAGWIVEKIEFHHS